MKNKTGKIAIVCFLLLNMILQIIYQFVIRTKIPYEWQDACYDVHYPQTIADHFADCFFFMNYFLIGYLMFDKKHYNDSMTEGRLANRWRYCAWICQIGGLAVYTVLWLGFTDSFRPLLIPVNIPDSYVFMLIYERLSEEQWDDLISYNMEYKYSIFTVDILAPAFLFYVVYFIHFIKMYFRRKKAGRPDKKWTRWNILFSIVLLLVFLYTFEALRGFDLISKIPGYTSYLKDYYRRNPPTVPPGADF